MALLAFLSLPMASQAVDAVFYGTGLGLALFGIRFFFGLIRRNVGRIGTAAGRRDAGRMASSPDRADPG